jgi:hypothetical protein
MPANLIAQYESLLSTEANENIIVEEGGNIRAQLIDRYRDDQAIFTTDQLTTLKNLKNILDAVIEFKDLLEILRDDNTTLGYRLESQQVAQEFIAEFHNLSTTLNTFPVMGRIDMEIRGINEILPALPLQEQNEIDRIIIRLDQNPPQCPRDGCTSNMVIRYATNRFSPFWGCRSFPQCWGRGNLTPEQRNLFPD